MFNVMLKTTTCSQYLQIVLFFHIINALSQFLQGILEKDNSSWYINRFTGVGYEALQQSVGAERAESTLVRLFSVFWVLGLEFL